MPKSLPSVYPIKPFKKPASVTVQVPGSKSITNRALAMGTLCKDGIDLWYGLESRDTEIMQKSLIALGRSFGIRNTEHHHDLTTDEAYRILVESGNKIELQKSSDGSLFPTHGPLVKLNVGNAGTAARFLTALLCLQDEGSFHVDGDEAMYKRPMKGLTDSLSSLGAEFTFHKNAGCIPFTLKTHGIKGDKVSVDASESSQILSALLIMAAGVGRPFVIELTGKTVSEPFVVMTEEMLKQFGVKVTIEEGGRYIVEGPVNFPFSQRYCVEPDATAASYFLALPIAVGGTSTVLDLGQCRLQGDIRFVNVLRSVGLTVKSSLDIPEHPNLVRASYENVPLRGITADFEAFSDTFLTLAALTPLLDGTTRIDGIAHTRRQETDRVAAMAAELRKLGQDVVETGGSLEIHPNIEAMKKLARAASENGNSGCIEIDTYHDHRFAMSFAILGCHDLLGDGKPWLAIKDPVCCTKTFPNFFEVLEDSYNQSHPFVTVAIDGGAATGKSSTARGLAAKLGYMHVDTGSHYRALTLLCQSHGVMPDDISGITSLLAQSPLATRVETGDLDAKIAVDGKVPADADLRSDAVNANVSKYAAQPVVRNALKDYQRGQQEIARQHGFMGLVMEGRDIGSVIFPDADVKIFLEADEATRAKRRAKEGQSDAVAERDKMDSTRKTAPLKCPEGATRLDNSNMTLDQVIDKIAQLVRANKAK